MTKTTKNSTTQQKDSRETSLDNIYSLLKSLEQDRHDLAKPYADLFGYALLPAMIYFIIHKLAVVPAYVRDVNSIEELIKTDLERFPKMQNMLSLQKEMTELVENFGQVIIDSAKAILTNDKNFRSSLRVPSIDAETSWPFPYRLDELAVSDDRHLLFSLARYADDTLTVANEGSSAIRSLYSKILDIIMRSGFGAINEIQLKQTAKILGMKSTPDQNSVRESIQGISTYRISELIQLYYPNIANFSEKYQKLLSSSSQDLRKQHVAGTEIIVTLVSAMLLKGLIVSPLLKRVMPINRYLEEPITPKNYNVLNVSSLKQEERKLAKAHAELLFYAKRNRRLSYAINILVWMLGLKLFIDSLATNKFALLKVIYAPLMIGMVLEKVLEAGSAWRDSRNVAGNIEATRTSLNAILAPIAHCISIEANDRKKLSLSTLRLRVTKPYQNELPASLLADVIKQTFVRCGINLLTSYTRLEFAISAQTVINISQVQKFFTKALERALELYRLKEQLNRLFQQLKDATVIREVMLDKEGLQCSRYLVNVAQYDMSVQEVLIKHGFVLKDQYLVLTRNAPFVDANFKNLYQEINAALLNPVIHPVAPSHTVSPTLEKRHPVKRTKSVPSSEEIEPIAEPEPRTITWPSSKTRFPGNAQPISGATNKYMLWTLEPVNFGEYQKDYSKFREKSTKLASSGLGSSGVKIRPTVSIFNNRTCVFDAYVKVPGSNAGVTLSKEKASTGETLYITQTFEPNIHQRLKS